MKLLTKSDIPFYISGNYLYYSIDLITDKTGANRVIGTLMTAVSPIVVPLTLVADTMVLVTLPARIGFRYYKTYKE